jgi:hypothetical protein
MPATDESENLLDHLTERINPNGWRVISNPARRPDPGAEELKSCRWWFCTLGFWPLGTA